MPIRRLTVAVTVTAAVLAATPAALAHDGGFGHPDHLTVTVTHSGNAAYDGTHHLHCHPAAGDHPDPRSACDGLDEATVWGKEPFAPARAGAPCTLQYGGPANAHIRGHWAGRHVNTHVTRKNGCEMQRWDTLVPLLPRMSPRGPGFQALGPRQ
ncbi:MAG: SSI family serine proteinase inhibitor [Streptomyces sp.]